MQIFRSFLSLLIASFISCTFVYAETFKGTVTRIIDGDTIRVTVKKSNIKVRLIGIDALEKIDNPKAQKDSLRLNQTQEFAKKGGFEARNYLSTLIAPGDTITLETDRSRYDQYGRTLAYIFDSEGTFINKKLILDGYAGLLIYAPNDSRARELSDAFDDSKNNKRGLWNEGFNLTYRWKR
jgi:micrococcal nuclease